MGFLHRSLVLVGATFWLAVCSVTHAETPASYLATEWDKEIILPPGAYRAAKPIALGGDFQVKTQPGTLVDGVSFLTRGGVQHYHGEGTNFRRCRFTVKRNGSGHFIDSALEECDFSKDDNWYNWWWSTRWVFDNCVFTKRFVRGDLPPLDYAVLATRCTFYGVKLPPVGYKENPAGYMGKGDMKFEKCRFVDCDVPQSFLASTVDCVFEGCRFEAKGKPVWPKETTAIKVHDYYAGTGAEPASFVNGPLTVEFEKAPRDGEFGSSVPHSQTGGRVTLTKLQPGGQFVQLATVPKKASTIVDPLAGLVDSDKPTPAPRVPTPVPTDTATAPGPAAVAEVRSVEGLLRTLPANIEVMANGLPNPRGIEAANAFLAKTYVGRAAALKMNLASTQAIGDGKSYQANDRWQGVLYHGATIPSCAVATFREAAAAPLAKVKPQTDFAVRGVVNKAEFAAQGNALAFVVYVAEAKVLDSLAALAAPLPKSNATTGNDKLIGAWTVLIHIDANYWEQTFNADGTASTDGKRFGTWEVKDDQFVVRLEGGSIDTYKLPDSDGAMYGQNLDGWKLTLARPDQPTSPEMMAQIVGVWNFENHEGDGFHATYRLNADHTFEEGNKRLGRWNTIGNAVVFKWDAHGEWHDMFELPGKDGRLTGVNGFRHSLSLTRAGATEPPTRARKPGDTYFGERR